jgi:hypothetical protein
MFLINTMLSWRVVCVAFISIHLAEYFMHFIYNISDRKLQIIVELYITMLQYLCAIKIYVHKYGV